MGNYYRQPVEVILDMDSELFKRLEERAKKDDVDISMVLDMIMTLDVELAIRHRLNIMDEAEVLLK